MIGERKYRVEYMGGPMDGEVSDELLTRTEAYDLLEVQNGPNRGFSGLAHRDGRYWWQWLGERLIARWVATP